MEDFLFLLKKINNIMILISRFSINLVNFLFLLLFIIIFIYFFRSHTYNKFSRSYAQRKHIFRNIVRSFFRSSFCATTFYFFLFWSISLDHFSKPKLNIFEKYIEASIFKLCTTCDSLKKKKINSIGDYSKHVSPLSLLM